MTQKCSIQLQLSASTYLSDGRIDGEVQVDVFEAFVCNGVSVALQWHTFGKGNQEIQNIETQKLFEGAFEVGSYRYPFSFAAPKGPFSHGGTIVNVAWRAFASVDVPWAIDPSAVAPFSLHPHASMSDSDPYYYGPSYGPQKAGNDQAALPSPDPSTSIGGAPLVVRIIVAIFLPLLLVSLVVFAPILFIFIAPSAAFAGIRRWLVAQKIGKPNVNVEPRVVCVGDVVAVQIEFLTRARVEFGEASVTLECIEHATSRSGKRKKRYRHLAHTSTYPLRAKVTDSAVLERASEPSNTRLRTMRAGERCVLDAEFVVPPLPHTFESSSNKIVTHLKANLGIKRCPDWSETIAITVRPGRS